MDNVTSQKKTYILEPDEYKTSLQMHPGTTGHFIYTKGIFITNVVYIVRLIQGS